MVTCMYMHSDALILCQQCVGDRSGSEGSVGSRRAIRLLGEGHPCTALRHVVTGFSAEFLECFEEIS